MFLTIDKSEALSYRELERLGWKPEKINRGKDGVTGFPDFKCSDNRWVEVKNINNGDAEDGVSLTFMLHQMLRWEELSDNGEKVFLVITNTSENRLIGPLDISTITFSDLIEKILDVWYGKKQ